MKKRSWVLAGIIAVLMFATFYSLNSTQFTGRAVNLNAKLMAHYEFEGNLEDSTPRGNDGSCMDIYEECPSYEEGIKGLAARFDGFDDYVSIPVDKAVSGTLTLWVMPELEDTSNQEDTSAYLITMGSYKNNNKFYLMQKNRQVYTELGELYAPAEYTNINLNKGKWTFLALVWNSKNYRYNIYAITPDGIKVSKQGAFSPKFKSSCGTSDKRSEIGAFAVCGKDAKHFFKGRIDQVRIYNRILDEKEIEAIYQKDLGNN